MYPKQGYQHLGCRHIGSSHWKRSKTSQEISTRQTWSPKNPKQRWGIGSNFDIVKISRRSNFNKKFSVQFLQYKGWLPDGSVVLIRCFKRKQKLVPQALARHMEELPNMRHRHLVSVLGHCTFSHQDQLNPATTVFVVNEYISNGSLKDCLTGNETNPSPFGFKV